MGRQGSSPGAVHHRVGVPLDELVERECARRRQAGPGHGVQGEGQFDAPATGDEGAHPSCDHYVARDAGLGELVVRAKSRAARLCGGRVRLGHGVELELGQNARGPLTADSPARYGARKVPRREGRAKRRRPLPCVAVMRVRTRLLPVTRSGWPGQGLRCATPLGSLVYFADQALHLCSSIYQTKALPP